MATMTPRVGIALGSGSSRGWAHIGILRALAERGIEPTVVAGASVGSLVGAAYASGQLDKLEDWARDLGRVDVLRLLDARLRGGGVMSGDRLLRAIGEHIEDRLIEDLPIPFGAVATELETGVEVWLREGSMLDAVRASSGMPGLFTPIWHEGRWLIDGGVVNAVPVSLCRALGADYIIAVNLDKHLRPYPKARDEEGEPGDVDEGSDGSIDGSPDEGDEDEPGWMSRERWADLIEGWMGSGKPAEPEEPGLFEVIGSSIAIMQDRLTRSRMVGDPPEILLEPDLSHFQILDLHRAEEAIDIGRDIVERAERDVEHLQALLG